MRPGASYNQLHPVRPRACYNTDFGGTKVPARINSPVFDFCTGRWPFGPTGPRRIVLNFRFLTLYVFDLVPSVMVVQRECSLGNPSPMTRCSAQLPYLLKGPAPIPSGRVDASLRRTLPQT